MKEKLYKVKFEKGFKELKLNNSFTIFLKESYQKRVFLCWTNPFLELDEKIYFD